MTGWNWVQISAALVCAGFLWKVGKAMVRGIYKGAREITRLIESIKENTAAQDDLTASLQGFQKRADDQFEVIDKTLGEHESRLLELEDALPNEEKAG